MRAHVCHHTVARLIERLIAIDGNNPQKSVKANVFGHASH
jgi:hypothetical protein